MAAQSLLAMICGEVNLLGFWVVDGWLSLSVSSGVIDLAAGNYFLYAFKFICFLGLLFLFRFGVIFYPGPSV